MKPRVRPLLIENVKGMAKKVTIAGTDSVTSSKSIRVTAFSIKAATSTRAGAVASCGTALMTG